MTAQDILAMTSVRQLQELDITNFTERIITQPEYEHIFKLCKAYWVHNGDPKAPHAELTTGKCSNGFINTLEVLSYTNLCKIFADQLFRKLAFDVDLIPVHRAYPYWWVIGSDHAGAAFSHSVATLMKARHDFTEKGPNKTQIWNRFQIQEGETVLQVEELITTTATVKAVQDGLIAGNTNNKWKFAPAIGTVVHRPDPQDVDPEFFEGQRIISLFRRDISTWDGPNGSDSGKPPKPCPLCAAGSKRFKPKANWAELTQV